MSLQVQDLRIEYPGHLVFDDVNLDVEYNEIIAIFTRVLDGGTSLLRGIGGFLQGVDGHVRLEDKDLLNCSPATRADYVGYVYEERGLVSLYTVYQNITLPLKFHSEQSEQEIHAKLHELCQALNLDEAVMGCRPHELNDVQTRLVNLARALIVEPKLLLIDELEGGMSEEYLRDTMTILRQRQQQHPMAIIITTADDYVMNKADRVFSIADHNLVLEH